MRKRGTAAGERGAAVNAVRVILPVILGRIENAAGQLGVIKITLAAGYCVELRTGLRGKYSLHTVLSCFCTTDLKN